MLTTAPCTPQENGTSECGYCHIVETGLTLLHQAYFPLSYEAYPFQTAVYFINHMLALVLQNKSFFECLFGRQPNYKKLSHFGCQCFMWLKPYNSNKM